jgi:acetyl esterase/lipase
LPEALAGHARAHGVYVQLERYPTEAHVFHVFWSFLPKTQEALTRAGQFINDAVANRPSVSSETAENWRRNQ